ncbi:MAG: ATP-binding protein [Prevotellaceae bacterium]|jgi:hypothetical protein|nr:ATP-binding protein [Prevotellaceae bacterium]
MQDFSAHIMDIAQNSVRANASRIEIEVNDFLLQDSYSITVRDNGCGMDAETLAKVSDPFFTSRTVRKVGLGIPLLKQNAEATGGYVTIWSEPKVGTTIRAVFSHTHIDRPPVGDIPGVIVLLAAANPNIEIIYKHKTDSGEYIFNSIEVKKFLDGVPLNDPEIVQALRQMIEENLNEIKNENQ